MLFDYEICFTGTREVHIIYIYMCVRIVIVSVLAYARKSR